MEILGTKVLLAITAGVMVFFALPLARLQRSPLLEPFLYALAPGILLYLLLDLVGHARELPLELIAPGGGEPGGPALLTGALFAGGLGAGFWLVRTLLGQWDRSRAAPSRADQARLNRRLRISTFIAISVGFYNLAQGVGIGEAGLFTVPTAIGDSEGGPLLIVGFALHSAAKGVAIFGPLAGLRPAWRDLLIIGLIAGLPTIAGTVTGIFLWMPYAFVGMLTFASGAMIAVIYDSIFRDDGYDRSKGAIAGLLAGFALATVTTFVLEMSHYSLPELKSSFWL